MHPGILPLYIPSSPTIKIHSRRQEITSTPQIDIIPLSLSIPVSNIEKRATKTGNPFLSKTFQKYLPSPRKESISIHSHTVVCQTYPTIHHLPPEVLN